MIHLKSFNEAVNRHSGSYPYKINVKDGVGTTVMGGNSIAELLRKYVESPLQPPPDQFEIWKNSRDNHSSTQDEYLMMWHDKSGTSYWSNRAKKEPELYRKCYDKLLASKVLQELTGKTGVFDE